MRLPLPEEYVTSLKNLNIWDAYVWSPTGSYQLLNKNSLSTDSWSYDSPKKCHATQAIWQFGPICIFQWSGHNVGSY